MSCARKNRYYTTDPLSAIVCEKGPTPPLSRTGARIPEGGLGRDLVATDVRIPRSMCSRLKYLHALMGSLHLGIDFLNLDCAQAMLLNADAAAGYVEPASAAARGVSQSVRQHPFLYFHRLDIHRRLSFFPFLLSFPRPHFSSPRIA